MPRNSREYIQRYADHAVNDMQRALSECEMIIRLYRGIDPPADGESISAEVVAPADPSEPYYQYVAAVQSVGTILAAALTQLIELRTKYL